MTQELLDLTRKLDELLTAVAYTAALRRAEIRRTVQPIDNVPNGVHRPLQEPYRSEIKVLWDRIERHIGESGLVQTRSFRVVSYRDVPIPNHIIDAYESLYLSAYGSDALRIGDDNQIHGSGKAERGRVKSDQVETRGGAIQKKKLSASRKDVIKHLPSYQFKLKVDKRLRKMSKEIGAFLADTAESSIYHRCVKCKRIGEEEWNHCPRCGQEMEQVNTDEKLSTS